jgi:hypothetical protein
MGSVAADGVLLFGISSVYLFAVLQALWPLLSRCSLSNLVGMGLAAGEITDSGRPTYGLTRRKNPGRAPEAGCCNGAPEPMRCAMALPIA